MAPLAPARKIRLPVTSSLSVLRSGYSWLRQQPHTGEATNCKSFDQSSSSIATISLNLRQIFPHSVSSENVTRKKTLETRPRVQPDSLLFFGIAAR